jgi:hypothetical protein
MLSGMGSAQIFSQRAIASAWQRPERDRDGREVLPRCRTALRSVVANDPTRLLAADGHLALNGRLTKEQGRRYVLLSKRQSTPFPLGVPDRKSGNKGRLLLRDRDSGRSDPPFPKPNPLHDPTPTLAGGQNGLANTVQRDTNSLSTSTVTRTLIGSSPLMPWSISSRHEIAQLSIRPRASGGCKSTGRSSRLARVSNTTHSVLTVRPPVLRMRARIPLRPSAVYTDWRRGSRRTLRDIHHSTISHTKWSAGINAASSATRATALGAELIAPPAEASHPCLLAAGALSAHLDIFVAESAPRL